MGNYFRQNAEAEVWTWAVEDWLTVKRGCLLKKSRETTRELLRQKGDQIQGYKSDTICVSHKRFIFEIS